MATIRFFHSGPNYDVFHDSTPVWSGQFTYSSNYLEWLFNYNTSEDAADNNAYVLRFRGEDFGRSFDGPATFMDYTVRPRGPDGGDAFVLLEVTDFQIPKVFFRGQSSRLVRDYKFRVRRA